jgi:transglutaminase-like putative cysteine protease
LNRCYALAALVFTLIAAPFCAASAPSVDDRIQTLESQYLAAANPAQRKQCIGELKSLAKNSSDAGTVNAAIAQMLPAAGSTWEAEELLAIGAAIASAQRADSAAATADTEFLVNPRSASQGAATANGDVETLADIRIDHVQQDSKSGFVALAHVQQLWRINTAHGAANFSPRPVVYSGISETLSLVRARVLKSDGREEAAVVSPDRAVVKRDAAMYFDARLRELHFAHLQPGDLVEVEYFLQPRPSVDAWPDYYARIDQFKATFPTRLQRRVLIAPSTMKLYSVARGLTPDEREQGGDSIRIWEARNAANCAQACSAASQPYLHVSTIGSIEEFGRWYSQLLAPTLQLDENLQNVAQKIAARNLSVDGKVQAVYETVKHLTKYTGFEFGVHSYQPYPVSIVERRGFGDCKDKAAMLVALLRAVGVETEFAMIRTRAAGALADGAYSAQQFDHAIIYVPQLDLYVDGTAESAAPGALPYNDLGAMAITVDASGNATRRMVMAHSGAPAQRNGTEVAAQTSAGTSMAAEQRP